MSDRTISGWVPIPDGHDPRLAWFPVPGTHVKFLLEKVAGPYLVAFAADYNKSVAPLDGTVADDWGWSPMRNGRASTQTSDHCAGRAIDLNATGTGSQALGNPNLGEGWLTRTKRYLQVQALLRKYPYLQWGARKIIGGSYDHLSDPMHFNIKPGVTDAQIAAAVRALGGNATGTNPNPKEAHPVSDYNWIQIWDALRHCDAGVVGIVTRVFHPNGPDGKQVMWSDLTPKEQGVIATLVGAKRADDPNQ